MAHIVFFAPPRLLGAKVRGLQGPEVFGYRPHPATVKEHFCRIYPPY